MTATAATGATGQPRLRIVPCDLADANDFVRRHHRHHQPVPTHKFSLAAVDEANMVRGVCVVFRPAARMLDDGWTAEVSRLATDGCPNACSALYGAAWRVARAMGYRRMTTYILDSETGTSLKASGWRLHGRVGWAGKTWNTPSRPRIQRAPTDIKQRWEVGERPPFPPPPDFGRGDPSPQLAFEWLEQLGVPR